MRTAFTFLKACHMHIDFNFFCVLWSTDLLSRSYKAMSVTSIKGGKKTERKHKWTGENWVHFSKDFFFSGRSWLFLSQRKCKEFASHWEVSLEGIVNVSHLGMSVFLSPGSGGHPISKDRGDTSKYRWQGTPTCIPHPHAASSGNSRKCNSIVQCYF